MYQGTYLNGYGEQFSFICRGEIYVMNLSRRARRRDYGFLFSYPGLYYYGLL
jgi:hypothetical protein